MIDCKITENYFNEKARMTKRCELGCSNCPLNKDKILSCIAFQMLYPEKAIATVQKWSDEHPQKTFLSEFLKHYPNAELNHGVPKICLRKLRAVSGCAKTKKGDLISCAECWNQPIENGEE